MSDQDIKTMFKNDTKNHVMTVLHDDGLYRHLRFRRPDESFYWFDITTWPGYLCISGDMGCFVFTRIEDMFDFFGTGESGISPDYWGEKCVAISRDGKKKFSPELYKRSVEEWLKETLYDMTVEFDEQDEPIDSEDMTNLKEAVQDELLDWYDGSEEDAYRRMRDFTYEENGVTRTMGDTWEWDLREYTFHYIWCLYAITWAIKQYREAKQ